MKLEKITYELKEPCKWSLVQPGYEQHNYVDITSYYSSGKSSKQTLELPLEEAKRLTENMKAVVPNEVIKHNVIIKEKEPVT